MEQIQYLINSKRKFQFFWMEYGERLKSKSKNNPFKNMHPRKKHRKIYSTYSMKISKTKDVFKIALKVASGGHLALHYSSTI